MKDRLRKQLYDELATFIKRQTLNGSLSLPESNFLLDYTDGIFFDRIAGQMAQTLRLWLEAENNNEECEEIVYRRLLDTDLKDENAVAASEAFISELLDYYRNLKH